jgi:hypothetical protein
MQLAAGVLHIGVKKTARSGEPSGVLGRPRPLTARVYSVIGVPDRSSDRKTHVLVTGRKRTKRRSAIGLAALARPERSTARCIGCGMSKGFAGEQNEGAEGAEAADGIWSGAKRKGALKTKERRARSFPPITAGADNWPSFLVSRAESVASTRTHSDGGLRYMRNQGPVRWTWLLILKRPDIAGQVITALEMSGCPSRRIRHAVRE